MNNRESARERLRQDVTCRVLLEEYGYHLDRRESTRRAQKWRRNAGEIIIVNHDGRGWWDPLRSATDRFGKGDIFCLAQYLRPGLDFLDACEHLERLIGVGCASARAEHRRRLPRLPRHVAWRWAGRDSLSFGSHTWTYLTVERCLPASVLVAAARNDAIRQGPHGSAWFAHRDQAGKLTGIEMRGRDWRSFSKGGQKSLFRLSGGSHAPARLTVSEAPIDALSLAAIEAVRRDTLYLATGGGMGPLTIVGLERLLIELAGQPGGHLIQATDADLAGHRYAEQLAALAKKAGVRSERLRPPPGFKDWNDVLKRAGQSSPG